MKKYLFSLVFFAVSIANAQEKNLKIFKFQPFSLITGSMNFNQEIFNKSQTRSTVFGIGLRYVNKDNEVYNYDNFGNSTPYTQTNKWQGATASVDRRFYVPGFFSGDKYTFINEKAKFGVYLSAGLKLEYNINNYDNSSYIYIPDTTKLNSTYKLSKNTGKVSYLGIMPNMNIGMQFTLFQNLYIDTYIGGGIRFISKKISNEVNDGPANGYNYYVNSNAIETFVIKEGVQPNFGFSLGLNF
ncbi:hypothetical protein [Lacihabitans sp. LS3-19]|uniref:hypothetical protein n=1 Tax=Lacihabitans sp. LS3-19 TaxID=2487335 RepID=UPI0020CC2AA1|nr:hypothetical protein [Lacihabitans sp. LS3-19]